MNQRINWSEAAKYGLFLSVITVVLEQVSYLFSLPGYATTIINLIKFAGSVTYLYYIMKRNASMYDFPTYGLNFRYGLAVCSFSGLVCSMFTLLTFTVFYPEATGEMLDAVFSTYESMGMAELDYDSIARVFPISITIAKFLSCFIVGLIASAIIASMVKKGNETPFTEEDFNQTEEE